MIYYVDADDFHEKNTDMEYLAKIKESLPNFKITLFTIVGLCSADFIKKIKDEYDWIDLVPHGWLHRDLECQYWSYDEMINYLDRIEHLEMTKGFRAPGWGISKDCYKALKDKGYWIAEHEKNRSIPEKYGLRAHYTSGNTGTHFHIGDLDCNKNNIRDNIQKILGFYGDFRFLKEYFDA